MTLPFLVLHKENKMNTLEQLLSQPLNKIVDNAFSLRVIEQINRYQAFRVKVFSILAITLSLVFVGLFPVKDWLVSLFNSTQKLAGSFAQNIMPSEVINQVKLVASSSEVFQQPSALISLSFITLFMILFCSSYLVD